ncbi:hypothetical protein LBMAG42_36130 [Deltaproteobacteria bacterium]|nr:hypothetical protein LBMAG42_36130 [Deltaproteobacteria bacterium]
MLLLISLVHAADSVPDVAVDGQLYRPPLDAEATLWADDSSLRPGFSGGLSLGWVHEPVVWVWEDTGERVPLVGDAVGLDLLASYTFWRIRAGVDVPVYPFATGSAGSGAGLGDIALDVKGVLLDRAKAPLGLAVSFRADLPTAIAPVPLAAGGFAYEAALIADKKLGPVLLAANIGTRGVPAVEGVENIEIGPQLAWRVGAGFAPGSTWGASLDVAGYATWSDLGNAAGSPAEAMVGGWYKVGPSTRLSLGLGHAISSGIGASNGRAVAGVSWSPEAKAAVVAPKPVAKAEPPKPVVTPAPVAKAEPPKPAVAPAPVAKTEPPKPAVAPAPVAKTEPPKPAVTPAPVIAPAPVATVAPVVPPPPKPVVAVPTAGNPVIVSGTRLVLYQRVAFDGVSLRPEGKAQLDAIAKYLETHREIESMRIEGHTGGGGDASDELGLAGSRAGAVLEYLIAKGLDRSRFFAAGYGSMRPLVQGTDDASRAVNDRIEFVITRWAEGSEPR